MSLKTRIRLSVAVLIALVVVAVSVMFLYDFTHAAIDSAADSAHRVANQAGQYIADRVDQVLKQDQQLPAQSLQQRVPEILRNDPQIPARLKQDVSENDSLLDMVVIGPDGKSAASFLHSPLSTHYKTLEAWKEGPPLRNLWQLLVERENYVDRTPPYTAGDGTPLFTVQVVVRSSFLRHKLAPAFTNLGYGFLIALAVSLALAWLLPTLALRPLERVSRKIDLISAGQLVEAPDSSEFRESREYADVQSKLNLLGQQFHGARRDALELRNNLDELLERIEEVVILFDPQGRVVMAGRPAEQLLGMRREALLSSAMATLFPADTPVGSAIAGAIERNQPVRDRVVYLDAPGRRERRLLLSVELLSRGDSVQRLGVLVRLRDPETRKQLESHLDLSTRLAAISRLTSGVAHEIKNPLNAIALHLEILRTRMLAEEPEIDLITREVRRLDHVVRTFLNFNKPLELDVAELNLTDLVVELTEFVRPDAEARGISVETDLQQPAWIKGDSKMLHQAVLNVFTNAIEAMGENGCLRVSVGHREGECVLMVGDSGPGIPREIQDRIFDLYFTTKEQGSGIGLALTFRMMQLHGGTIDFVSEPGQGTSFCLRFPEASTIGQNRLALSQARA